MKRQIRFGMFESNSSTTHTCWITTEDIYNKLSNGYYLFVGDNYAWDDVKPEKNKAYTKDEVKELIKNHYKYYDEIDESYERDHEKIEDDWDDAIWEADFINEERIDSSDFEYFSEYYTTPGGEKVVAFGYYGYN